MIDLNNEDFDLLIKDYVLVDFYATWCGPCKMLHPVLEQIDSIKVITVDVDKHEDIARKYGVMSIPTLILFKDSVEIDKKVGYQALEIINKWIKENK